MFSQQSLNDKHFVSNSREALPRLVSCITMIAPFVANSHSSTMMDWTDYIFFMFRRRPRFCIASPGTRVPSICAIKHFSPVFCSRPPSLRTVLMYNNDVEYCSCQPALPCFRTLRLLWAFRVLILGERIGNFINLIKYCMSETAKQRGKFAVCFSELRKLGRIKKERFSYRRRCQVIMLMRLFAWLGKQWAFGCLVFIMQCYVGESFPKPDFLSMIWDALRLDSQLGSGC